MSETKITQEQVKKISKLVNITLTNEELDSYASKFTDTLKYINVLDELDTSKVQETYQVNGQTDVYQDPKVKATLPQSEALANAHEVERNLFVTKGVFNRE